VTSIHPVAARRDQLEGRDLPPMPMWPAEMMPRPIASNRNAVWYAGEDLISCFYESDDGVVAFTDLPYDEHVHILNGRAVLTSVGGRVDTYGPGDWFVAPKGWSGTWEMTDGYRELIVFHTASLVKAAQEWGID
jgi:uncharacterized cupin superfamily protein